MSDHGGPSSRHDASTTSRGDCIQHRADREIPFLITISYLSAFLLIRAMVLIAGSAESEFAQAAKLGGTPDVRFAIGRNVILFGHHIHHFYVGILLMAVAGWIAIVGVPSASRRVQALLYGAGLGLFMDEIGLLLTWGDYYSSATYLMSLLLIGIFLNIVFFSPFWREFRRHLLNSTGHAVAWTSFPGTATLLKGADIVSQKTDQTERISLIFMGVLYLGLGVLILIYPRFLYYWVAGAFIVHGVSSLGRAWQRSQHEPSNGR